MTAGAVVPVKLEGAAAAGGDARKHGRGAEVQARVDFTRPGLHTGINNDGTSPIGPFAALLSRNKWNTSFDELQTVDVAVVVNVSIAPILVHNADLVGKIVSHKASVDWDSQAYNGLRAVFIERLNKVDVSSRRQVLIFSGLGCWFS
eukprot:CAMPEP_0184977810 /NCGR_PEP_ID=MMETSP1098-20130426/8458_1 /TAXON_ID=89044 /ORGANISM="Spumella elongata, Strain CCAP 955/1" /LENGTH=146 /DNA_ID=CAMNT_0027500871 /DNA_START=1371 /DNA_END=1811 /DNA_ORIENTATION=+